MQESPYGCHVKDSNIRIQIYVMCYESNQKQSSYCIIWSLTTKSYQTVSSITNSKRLVNNKLISITLTQSSILTLPKGTYNIGNRSNTSRTQNYQATMDIGTKSRFLYQPLHYKAFQVRCLFTLSDSEYEYLHFIQRLRSHLLIQNCDIIYTDYIPSDKLQIIIVKHNMRFIAAK